MTLNKIRFNRAPLEIVDGKPLFINQAGFQKMRSDLHTGLVNNLKTYLKKFSRLYSFIFYFIAPAVFLGKEPKYIYKFLTADGLVVNIGSGNRRLYPDTVNVDIYPWSEVDIVADSHDLPFEDNSVDGIILSWVIEHLEDPKKVVNEIRRVLRSGGYLYLSTNFITPYHPSPKDYYRWTRDGLEILLSQFEIVELKPHVGPTCAFLSVFQEWLALVFSFNSKLLKDILWIFFVVVTSPLKLLDLILIRYSSAEKITAGFYAVAKKG